MIKNKVALVIDDPSEGVVVLIMRENSKELFDLMYELRDQGLRFKEADVLAECLGPKPAKAAKKKKAKIRKSPR